MSECNTHIFSLSYKLPGNAWLVWGCGNGPWCRGSPPGCGPAILAPIWSTGNRWGPCCPIHIWPGGPWPSMCGPGVGNLGGGPWGWPWRCWGCGPGAPGGWPGICAGICLPGWGSLGGPENLWCSLNGGICDGPCGGPSMPAGISTG